MMPIQLSSPAPARCEAKGADQDTDDAGTQSDDFSAMLAALFAALPAVQQVEQQVSTQDQAASVVGPEAISQDCSSPSGATTQLFNPFAQPGIQTDAQVADAKLKLNDILEKLQKIEEKPIEVELPQAPAQIADAKFKLNDILEKLQKIEEKPMEVELPEATAQKAQNLPPLAQPETRLLPANFTQWLKEGFGNPGLSPADNLPSERGLSPALNLPSQPAQNISVQFAAAFHTLQNEVRAGSDSVVQPESFEPETQATSAVTTTSLLKEKASPFTEKQVEPSAETADASQQGYKPSEQTAPALSAPSSTSTAQGASTAAAQNITAQVAHAMAEVADEVSIRHEARSLRLRLHPEELGEVRINITTDVSGRLSAQITAEHDFTRRAIAGGLDHLRETLEHAGVNLDRLDMGLSQRGGADSGAQTQTNSRNETMRPSDISDLTPTPLEVSGDGQPSEEEERLLSLRA